MMALSKKKMLEDEPGDIEMLLPWHAAGTLNARDARRVEEALARDPDLARQYAAVREEYAETIHLNESLGAPSARAMQQLFAAIEAEPARRAGSGPALSSRILNFLSSLSPRTLAWSAALGALLVVLQAAIIGAILVKNQDATFQTASLSTNEPITRSLGPQTARALVRFTPEARVADITALLDSYHASIVGTAQGGVFRLQFASAVSQDEIPALLGRMQHEKIVDLAVAAP